MKNAHKITEKVEKIKICNFKLSYLVRAACIYKFFLQDYKELFAEEETGKVKAERRSTEDDSSTYTGQPTLNIPYRIFSKILYTKAPMAACCSLTLSWQDC